MVDVHSRDARRRNMAAIRAKDTRPELVVRRGLHAAGYRFRLHNARLPGRPDIVLPRYHAAILVNGCFFHGHECRTFRWPVTRADFWREKIGTNRERDRRNVARLRAAGWRVLTVWECAIRGDAERRRTTLRVIDGWLRSSAALGEIAASARRSGKG